jgi:hypothetical protein
MNMAGVNQFSPREVLERDGSFLAALLLATSIQDLVKATGIIRGSI